MSEVENIADIQISIPAEGMTGAAQSKLGDYIQRFANDLVRETMRLEEGARAQDLDIREITTTMVIEANRLLRKPPDQSVTTGVAHPFYILVLQIVAFTAGIVAGAFASYLNSAWQWTCFGSFLSLAVVSQFVSAYMIWRRRWA